MSKELQILTREKRIKIFQIECPSEIVFSNWFPDGRVYTKQLTMKNVSNQLLTLTYKLPELACFFTPFPDQIVLPIGMEHSITVSFQPVNPVEVESALIFHVNQFNEDFKIQLRGDLPTLSAKTNLAVDFPIPTAVNEENSVDIPLKNNGEVDFSFQFTLPSGDNPYSVLPMSGKIIKGEHLMLRYTFRPTLSGQLQAKVVLNISKSDLDGLAKVDSINYIIQLNAIAKFPFFRISIDDQFTDQLSFVNTPVIAAVEKQIYIVNESQVKASFHISKNTVLDRPYNQIQIFPEQGVVDAGGKFLLKVVYNPAYAGSFYQVSGQKELESEQFDERYTYTQFDPLTMAIKMTFEIQTRSIITAYFSVVCSGAPVDVSLSQTKVDFGCVQCGSSSQKSIYIKNNSKQDCPYELTTEGYTPIKGPAPDAYIQPDVIEAPELSDITRPKKRTLSAFPLRISPSSGIAPSQINTTVNLQLNLLNYTSQSQDLLMAQSNNKAYIPPQPISFFVQFKAPGAPVQFIHITATILPEEGIDQRPAPLTMDYAEQYNLMRREYSVDELMGMMVPCPRKNLPAMPMNSPLYNDKLVEFETEYASSSHVSAQALNKMIGQFNPTEFEVKPQANALLPTDALLLEFEGKIGLQNGYPADISHRAMNFGYVQMGQDKKQMFTIRNNSEQLELFCAFSGTTSFGCFDVEFLGLSENEGCESRSELHSSSFTLDHGLEFRTALTKGLVVRIPPLEYGYFEVTFKPQAQDEIYYAKLAVFSAHQPLLLYRCFRHAIVGYSFIQEVSLCGVSRQPTMMALCSSLPIISQPVMNNHLRLPPTAPGSIARSSFALTNNGSSFVTVNLSPLTNDFIHVYPEIIGLDKLQTVIVSVCLAFPEDSLTHKEKYGFTFLEKSENAVSYDDVIIFNINGSEATTIKLNFTAVCCGLDVIMERVDAFTQIVSQLADDEKVEVDMAPVSLGSESSRLMTIVNKSLLPVSIISVTTSQRDACLMYITPNDIIIKGCEEGNYKYVLKAAEQYLTEKAYTFEMKMIAEIPRQYCLPVPDNLIGSKTNKDKLRKEQTLVIGTSVTKRTVELQPPTINIPGKLLDGVEVPYIVPYTTIDIPIQINNSSHCSISYTLEIHEILTEMPTLEFEKEEKTIRRYPYTAARNTGDYIVPNLYNKLYNQESVMSDLEAKRCPQIYIKSGAGMLILPHSSFVATLTVQPFSNRAVRAKVYAKIIEVDAADRKLSEVVQELEDQAIYMQGTVQAFQQFQDNIDRNRMFECKLEVTPDFPRFFISDISCPKIGSSQLRDILNVEQINNFLSGEVSVQERVFLTPCQNRDKLIQGMVDRGELAQPQPDQILETEEQDEKLSINSEARLDITAPEQSQIKKNEMALLNNKIQFQEEQRPNEELLLREFPLVLGPDNLDQNKSYFVVLTLANPGDIPCTVSFNVPSGPELSDCPWVQQLPSSAQQRTMSLLARKIYSVAPTEVTLQPHEKQSLTINYAHIEEGVHELIVLARILGGRTFFLHLIGSTLGEYEPALIAPVEQRLLPISLGEIIPPRQYVKVHNPGKAYVNYKFINPKLIYDVDLGSGEGSYQQQVDQILKVLNPIGVIAPNSTLNIVLQFTPNQVGLVHCKFDLCIQKISEQEYNNFKPQKKYFPNECNVDLPDESLVGAEKKPPIKLAETAELDTEIDVYQQIDVFAYGFVKNQSVPTFILPSFAKNGEPKKPACGAVAIQNISFASRNNLITQRGLGYCELSCGRLVLGGMPTFGKVSAVIELTCCKNTEPGYTNWEVLKGFVPICKDRNAKEFQTANLKMVIAPCHGRLEQGEKVRLFIEVHTGPLPAVFLEDIPFMVEFVSTAEAKLSYGVVSDGRQRLPAILANTVSSAARISETAILQQFDPTQQNRAGLDQQTRQQHAMLYGVEDRVSAKKCGPLSQYMTIPDDDVLWLTITCHSHRMNQLQDYAGLSYGLQRNPAALQIMDLFQGGKDIPELNDEDQQQLENLVGLAMRGAVNKLISDKYSAQELIKQTQAAKRDALNQLNKANFFQVEEDNPIQVVDSQVPMPKTGQQVEDFLNILDNVLGEE